MLVETLLSDRHGNVNGGADGEAGVAQLLTDPVGGSLTKSVNPMMKRRTVPASDVTGSGLSSRMAISNAVSTSVHPA